MQEKGFLSGAPRSGSTVAAAMANRLEIRRGSRSGGEILRLGIQETAKVEGSDLVIKPVITNAYSFGIN